MELFGQVWYFCLSFIYRNVLKTNQLMEFLIIYCIRLNIRGNDNNGYQ